MDCLNGKQSVLQKKIRHLFLIDPCEYADGLPYDSTPLSNRDSSAR
jgi:hypothetical protein